MADDWFEQTITELQKSGDYREQALLAAVLKYQQELKRRTVNAQGELDGRIWNHEQW